MTCYSLLQAHCRWHFFHIRIRLELANKEKKALMFLLFLSPTVTLPCCLHAFTVKHVGNPTPCRLHVEEWALLSRIHCGRGLSLCKICNRKKTKTFRSVVGCEMFKVWPIHCGGWRGSPTASEEAKRKVLLFDCTPRPGTDISTLTLTLLVQRP